jgi:hypothetical protein
MSLDAIAEQKTGVTVGEVDEATARRNLDNLAQRFLLMSGQDFMQRVREGRLDDIEGCPGFSRVLAVATLLD